MIIKNAQVFEDIGGFAEKDIFIQGEFFCENPGNGDIIDASGCYAVPGLIDIHLHGCTGYDFSQANVEEIAKMAQYQALNGITAICPTTMTLPEDILAKACRNIVQCDSAKEGAFIAGINLEGPFVSPKKLGAQNPLYVQKPNAELFYNLQKAAEGKVKILAIAPEEEGALEVIKELSPYVVCSLAHTAADYDTAMESFKQGAKQVTHLYNAMPPFSHREPGVIGAALDWPQSRAELICDNVHVHPSVVRATFSMFSDERIIFISDSMMATGLDDGIYELGGQAVEVKGNIAKLSKGGAIAGSVTNLLGCVRAAVNEMGIPLYSAVKCASANPAKAIGIFESRGSITAGKYADLVLLDEGLDVKQVFLRGKPLL